MQRSKTYQWAGWLFLALLFLAAGCNKPSPEPQDKVKTGQLTLLGTYPMKVSEPSGLSFGPLANTLLTVSDNTAKVYEIDLQGKILKTFAYAGQDLEGVGYDPITRHIAVAEERKREIVFLDEVQGVEQRRYHMNIPAHVTNKGIEGLSFNKNNRKWYFVNEAIPGLLCVWDVQDGLLEKKELDFASDYSGIYADAAHSLLWIVSDESKALYQCDYNANVLKKYPLDKNKYEGVVVDLEKSKVYLVNDATGELCIYQIEN